MDTRWKRFRYGSEDTNPAWSFYAAVVCLSVTVMSCPAASADNDGIWWVIGSGCMVLSMALLAYLGLLVSNRKEDAVPVKALDRWQPDFILAVFSVVVFQNRYAIWQRYSYTMDRLLQFFDFSSRYFLELFLVFSMTMVVAAFVVFLYMSVVRHLCRDKLKKTLFFYLLFCFVRETGRKRRSRWETERTAAGRKDSAAGQWRRRQLLWIFAQLATDTVIFCLVAGDLYDEEMFLVIFIKAVYILLYLLSSMRFAKELGVLLEEIRQMSEDGFSADAPVLLRRSLFHTSEEELLAVQKIRKESLEKQLQSERMKVELITNVSHDLKTPLTSMVGCIDRLAQTEGLPREAEDYVKVLSAKAERLREMIQDVFDMAKAASGGQDMNIERLDMARLIRQTVADMQDRMDASGLIFRIKLEEKELPFMGDGRKLYRVYQNLIENTLKYSMAGSRVYIEAKEQDDKIITSIKNISDCEMDFDAAEIMERFTRGDKTRSTEGNGLGLAIARSFTIACGGSFQVTIDADLFKAEAVFPKIILKGDN